MKPTGIVFPHQLFEDNILISACSSIYLVEEFLFFGQYKFHKAKIAFHRASMKFYESYLREKGVEVVYIESQNEIADIQKLIKFLKKSGISKLEYIDTTDNWLEKRITGTCKENSITTVKHSSPLFLNTPEENARFFSGRKNFFQTDFYKYQRISKNILVEKDGKPVGGKWTFDAENRLRYPKDKIPPPVSFPVKSQFYAEAFEYTEKYFPDNYGKLNNSFLYPTNFGESKHWLQQFLQTRFAEFGVYEDAIVAGENILNHSVLTPMLNVGLITPQYIVEETLKFAAENKIPMNSLEGFIRQIIGWREFIRAVYELKGTEERTRNFWGFTRKIPPSFWNGTTGIEPVDTVIQKVLKTGYCHHIERLMVLGNFMLLCEFDPDEVYRWFMELFTDAYDWVMVPNVYGMTQFADGGLMATKPYISGSNYLMKMSDFKKGPWQEVWDGLFWRFMHVHHDFFMQNPRLGMLVRSFDKMHEKKQKTHLQNSENYLRSL
jgi:deoxyribodipyrimidine photolyase-related protein